MFSPHNYRVHLTRRSVTRLALSALRPHSPHGRAQGARPPRPAGDAGRWAYMRQALAMVAMSLVALPAVAGGDFVKGRIANFVGTDGDYAFHFEQIEARPELEVGCRAFVVSVRYARVPWYSWLPFIHTHHPTREQTIAAAAFLADASQRHALVNFGYMGSGLVPTGEKCSFRTKGLRLEKEGKEAIVLAYDDPI